MPEPVYKLSFDALISYPLAKIVSRCIRFNFLSPNMLTIFRMVPALVFYWTYLQNYYWESLGLFTFTIFTGCLDGTYARMFNLTSDYGAKLNRIVSKTIMILFWLVFLYKKWSIYVLGLMVAICLNRTFKVVKIQSFDYVSRFFNDNLTLLVILLYPYLF
jgi:phosphatidylglycerophosphate synthase